MVSKSVRYKHRTRRKYGGTPTWKRKGMEKSSRATKRKNPSMARITRRKRHLGNIFLVMVMGEAASDTINAIHTGATELNHIMSEAPTHSTSLVPGFTKTFRDMRPYYDKTAAMKTLFGPETEFWAVCTGNTCRSAALHVAGGELGVHINTCGSGVNFAGQNPTPAFLEALGEEGPSGITGRKIADKHLSKKCDPCASVLLGRPNKIYGVVAEKNKDDLNRMAQKCGAPPPNVVILGDIPGLEACAPLKIDPYFKSKKYVCTIKGPKGSARKDWSARECTPKELKEEKDAYVQLRKDTKSCVAALKEITGNKLKMLSKIAEEVEKETITQY